jgi:hypothetical protein
MMNKSYAHCASGCGRKFYPRWIAEQGEFEALCPKCLSISLWNASNEDDVNSLTDMSEFTSAQEALTESLSTALSDDPYHEYGEESMGVLNLFDGYGE